MHPVDWPPIFSPCWCIHFNMLTSMKKSGHRCPHLACYIHLCWPIYLLPCACWCHRGQDSCTYLSPLNPLLLVVLLNTSPAAIFSVYFRADTSQSPSSVIFVLFFLKSDSFYALRCLLEAYKQLYRSEGARGGAQRCTLQRHVAVMVAVTQKLTGWRDVVGGDLPGLSEHVWPFWSTRLLH